MKKERRANSVHLNSRTKAIIAARKRGWTLEQIGFACGFTRERARQILELERVKRPLLRLKPNTNKYQRKCRGCGKVEWVPLSQTRKKYCNKTCHGLSVRTAGGRFGQLEAIEHRLNGLTWTEIAGRYGHSSQIYWSGIWFLLHEYRFLKTGIVSQIFSKRGIDYQVRSTGIAPEHGFFPDNWLDDLKQRVTEDGDERPMIRKKAKYIRTKSKYARFYKPWTNREIALLCEMYPTTDITTTKLAKMLDRSPKTIPSMLRKLGLRKQKYENGEQYG